MSRYRLDRTWTDRLRCLVPFGLGHTKPRHFSDMARILWSNRDNLGYAWKVLSRGVCDGCALGVSGFRDWTLDGVHLCMTRLNLLRLNTMPCLDPAVLEKTDALASLSNRELRELGRLPFPLLRQKGSPGFMRISWEKAIRLIARRIVSSRPDRLAFYLTARGLTNEVYYVAQKAARYLGTSNIDNAARLCHAPSTAAMKRSLGVSASTCSYGDWIGSDLVVFFGSNPANDQPVSLKYLRRARRDGTRVVLVNPYREPGMVRYWIPSEPYSALFGSDIADFWFPVSQGGDTAFLSGVLRVLVEEDWIDRDFIARSTCGFEPVADHLRGLDWTQLEADSGLPREAMVDFARLVSEARSAVLVWSMGITQHHFGGETVQMILNLALSRGYVGRERCGVMPIRGHSSVQGGAEMGAYATALPGGVPVNPENAARLSESYGFPVPDRPGLSAPEMVEAARRGELDLLYCLGGNFLRTLPDPERVREALARVPLRVHQDLVLTDQMLVEGVGDVLLLPARTRYEQDDGGTETTTERRILFSPEIPRRVGEARAEWKILREVAIAARPERGHLFGCRNGLQIRREIAEVVPAYAGIEKLREQGDSLQYGGPLLCRGGTFPTSDGRARFFSVALPARRLQPGEYQLSTRRGKQFNSLVYSHVDPLNGAPRDAVLMSPEDAAELNLKRGDRVTLVNERGRLAVTVFPAPISRRNLQVHWPEGNVLIPAEVLDPMGLVPDYNARVRILPGEP